ncbi:hypothetical protein [Spongiimicrobium salis]|uniref:hypothetical protein n=1 Tax=Spongiimicrobium salis TaxID=1667022 RepID=UPI00374C8CF1
MCKSTKGTQSAKNAAIMDIPPNTAPGDPGGDPTPVPVPDPTPPITILREHVPDLVFIIPGAEPTVQGAVDFHEFFGFRGARLKRFSSIENMIAQLAASTEPLNRIRIIAHAEIEGILSPMVEGDTRVNIEKTELRAFLQGDGAWLFTKIQLFHFFGTGATASQIAEIVLGHILGDATHQAVLVPFEYTNMSHPRQDLIRFTLCALTPMVVQGNFIKRDGSNLNTSRKNVFISIYEKILELCRQNIIDGDNYPDVAIAQLNLLRDAIRSFSFANYGFTPGSTDISSDTFSTLERSMTALNNNFRGNLEQVQGRFSSSSWIDIRGCRAGVDRDYLVAVGEFFGRAANIPHVSGPRWFQKFPTTGFNLLDDFTAIEEVLNNGISGHDGLNISGTTIKSVFDDWLEVILYTDAYFDVWHTALNKKAAEFCLLNWQATIPNSIVIREGKQHGISTLNFKNTINRIKAIFGVPSGSEPRESTLNALGTFVSSDLPGHMASLTREISDSDTLSPIFDELLTISQQLAASVVPNNAPSDLDADQLRQFQTELIDFIDDNRLPHIKSLLANAQTHINGPNGKYHLYLRFGLPGMILFERNYRSNQIFALTSEKDNALRIFLREMWEEVLPTPNAISSALLDDSHSDHRAISALANDPSDTIVAVGPMPNYMENIEKT